MIYLDHAATTPLSPRARAAMEPFLGPEFGNPSGLYELGRRAQAAVDAARRTVAECLGAEPREIIFTSGGTESINAALLGIATAMRRGGLGAHVITTAIEHHAGLHAAQTLETLGFDVTYVGCDRWGRVHAEEVEAALRTDTVLVSVMLANNEVGTIQPVEAVADAVRRFAARTGHRPMLHTDAVQAAGWLRLDVSSLGVDALSLSAHKFGGPKGSGILFLRRGTPFQPLLAGGGQEHQKRAGTENVAGIAGTAAALAEAATGIAERRARVWALRERLREALLRRVPRASLNGCQEGCLPHILNVAFDGIESEALVRALDERGVAVSSGSACSNSTWEPSHVLLAMGVPIRTAAGSIRFSQGEGTTEDEVEVAAERTAEAIALLRAGSPREGVRV